MSDDEARADPTGASHGPDRPTGHTRRRLLIFGGAGVLGAAGIGTGLLLSDGSSTSPVMPSSALVAQT
jgi:hypothetical protein